MNSNIDRLKDQLEKQEWPALYMFKFIVPSGKLDELLALFRKQDTRIRLSSKGNYASVSATPFMMNADKVMEMYAKAMEIKGCLAL